MYVTKMVCTVAVVKEDSKDAATDTKLLPQNIQKCLKRKTLLLTPKPPAIKTLLLLLLLLLLLWILPIMLPNRQQDVSQCFIQTINLCYTKN